MNFGSFPTAGDIYSTNCSTAYAKSYSVAFSLAHNCFFLKHTGKLHIKWYFTLELLNNSSHSIMQGANATWTTMDELMQTVTIKSSMGNILHQKMK